MYDKFFPSLQIHWIFEFLFEYGKTEFSDQYFSVAANKIIYRFI